nr:MAG: internal scaffolding protein [Microvirus sp.]
MQAKRDESNNANHHYRIASKYDAKKASLQTALHCTTPSLTQQHQRDDADINVIVQRFGVTGTIPTARTLPEYGDFTGVNDYQVAMNYIIEAQAAFDALPAKTRRHFGDNPANLVSWIEAGPDVQLALDLGLAHLVSKPSETPPPTPPAPAPKDPPAS